MKKEKPVVCLRWPCVGARACCSLTSARFGPNWKHAPAQGKRVKMEPRRVGCETVWGTAPVYRVKVASRSPISGPTGATSLSARLLVQPHSITHSHPHGGARVSSHPIDDPSRPRAGSLSRPEGAQPQPQQSSSSPAFSQQAAVVGGRVASWPPCPDRANESAC